MKTLLEGIIEGFINEEPMKAVKKDTNRVVTYTNKDNYDAAIKQGTHRPFNPATDKDLEDEPAGSEDGVDAAIASDPQLARIARAGAEDEEDPKQFRSRSIERDREEKRKEAELARSVEKSIRRQYPNAREITIVDDVDNEEIEKLGVYTGETDLPADMRDIQEGYFDGGLDTEQVYKKLGRKRVVQQQTIEPELRTKLRQGGLAERYIDLIEMSLNVSSKVTFTELMDGVGAGQQASQFGEIMSMAMMTLRDPADRTALAQDLEGKITGGTIADKSWIRASVGHAEAFDAYMNEQYGEGGWRFEGAAWDRKEDIEALGLDYENKGFSTDAMLRVQPLDENGEPRGPAQAQRCSLKKDENVMFFNGGIGEINSLVRGYLSDNDRRTYDVLSALKTQLGKASGEQKDRIVRRIERILKKEEGSLKASTALRELDDRMTVIDQYARSEAARDNRPAGAVLDRVNGFAEEQTKSAVELLNSALGAIPNNINIKKVLANVPTDDIPTAQHSVAEKMLKDAMECGGDLECLRKKGYTSQKDISKLGTYVGAIAGVGDEKIKAQYQEHIDKAAELGDQFMELFSPDNPVMLKGLMETLAQKFPLNVAMSGTEFMVINGTHAGPQTLQQVFGVKSYEELEQGLKIVEVDGERILAYTASGRDEPIMVGTVQARQKGRGYNPVGFEIKCSDSFVLACAQANERNGNGSESNSAAIERISRRQQKRTKKKTKKESAPPELRKLIRDIAIWKLGKYGN